MPLNDRIFKLRTAVKMTREQFAEEFGVSRQTILKWENGTSYPELSKLIDISRRFDISLDSLILDRNMRMIEEFKGNYGKKTISPNYSNMHFWESYSSAILTNTASLSMKALILRSTKIYFLTYLSFRRAL